MTTVTLRNHGLTVEATPVGDTYTDQAVEKASELLARGVEFDQALVDRFDGLLLIGARGSWHFQTPLCGYKGNGPGTTAVILSMFGFGSTEEIMRQIDSGDNEAKAKFYR